MSKNISKNDTTGTNQVREPVKSAENLTAFCNNIMRESEVHLQTLRVKLKGPYNEHIVRALIDTGSHKTYALKSIADEMCLKVVGQQKMVHLLFGGEKTEPRAHNKYQFNLKGLDGEYECVINAYDEDLICRTLPSVSTGPWIAQLQSLGIALTDTGSSREPISLLIGADIAGKLYTGKMNRSTKGQRLCTRNWVGHSWDAVTKSKLNGRTRRSPCSQCSRAKPIFQIYGNLTF